METYSIKDLETLSGIKAHTIRIWEQRYGVIKPQRTDTNIRYYDAHELKKLLNISLLNQNGFKISKIANMSEEELTKEILEIETLNGNENIYINGLIQAMVDINEEHFDKIIATTNTRYGFEKTMLNIIYPFLKRIGVLWMTGAINPAQEHFITSLIRQKTISAIDGIFVAQNEYQEKYVLYLPEGELHELSLLFAYYILKSRKKQVIYLGQSLPINDVKAVCDFHQPAYVFTILTSSPDAADLDDYLKHLSESSPESQILVSGSMLDRHEFKLPQNVKYLPQVTDLMRLSNV